MLRNRINSGYLMVPEGEAGGGTGTGTADKGAEGTPSGKIVISGKEYSPEDAEGAISLYKAMKDPETSREIVSTLAQRMGLLKPDGTVKGDPEKVADKIEGRITKQLKAKLGKDYAQFADLVGGVLDEAIQELIGEQAEHTREAVGQQTWSQGVEKFMDAHKFTEDIETEMSRLVTRNPPNTKGKDFSQDEYLEDMYELACKKLNVAPKAKRRAAIEDDEDEVVVHKIRFAARPNTKDRDPLDDAIDAAMNGIKFRT